jgi:ketosteroid isomerase-like protein
MSEKVARQPMPEENIEVVRRFYDAWARDELPGPLELMDPGIEYVNPPGAIEAGTRRGVAEFAGAVEKLLESWDFWRAEPEEFRTFGNQVAVVVRYRTRGKGSGMEVEGRESALWTLRDGKVVRYQWFHGVADALEAIPENDEPENDEPEYDEPEYDERQG